MLEALLFHILHNFLKSWDTSQSCLALVLMTLGFLLLSSSQVGYITALSWALICFCYFCFPCSPVLKKGRLPSTARETISKSGEPWKQINIRTNVRMIKIMDGTKFHCNLIYLDFFGRTMSNVKDFYQTPVRSCHDRCLSIMLLETAGEAKCR